MDYILKEQELLLEAENETKKINDSIIEQLVFYRKQYNMTQQDIADATGIKRANIARMESKKHTATLDCLTKYAKCLGMELCLELKEKATL